jgi:nitrate/TMAO reductase-like tetraheme cytochrome c subunit
MDIKRDWVNGRTIVAITWAIVAVVTMGCVVELSDRPIFCTSCHEMRPFYNAWKQGPHKDVWCMDCHVEPTVPGRILHKFPVVRQLVGHVAGWGVFPLPTAPEVPDERCTRCHSKLPAKVAGGFRHTVHSKHECVQCHTEGGHSVTIAALKAANAYSGRALPARTLARLGGGAANINGHKQVECANCHNMGAFGCSTCHISRHARSVNRGANCALCHKPGQSFVFTHPAREFCEECHKAPADHKQALNRSVRGCPSCHRQPGVTWVAYHPGPTKPCQSCHRSPVDHTSVAMSRGCPTCHKRAGVSWSSSVH